jgi:hypothetical protein
MFPRPGPTAEPAATRALRAPLAHAWKVADEVVNEFGRGADDLRDRDAMSHVVILANVR